DARVALVLRRTRQRARHQGEARLAPTWRQSVVRPRGRGVAGSRGRGPYGHSTKMSTDGRSSAQVARMAWILWPGKSANGVESADDPLPRSGNACCMSAQSNRGAHFRAPRRAVVEQLSIM